MKKAKLSANLLEDFNTGLREPIRSKKPTRDTRYASVHFKPVQVLYRVSNQFSGEQTFSDII